MFALKRILVPTNLGEPSKAAIRYGVAFARQFGARLILLHVLPAKDFDAAIETERVMEALLPEEQPAPEPDPRDVVKNAAREELGQLLTPQEERDAQAEYVLRPVGTGGSGDEIVACARELNVELVVMGKHRLGFVEHLMAGSVTEKVMRHAPCPVLIVQHPEHEFVVPD
ncbi:MAG: universal stress protein [Steroidobacteraceae bacterium]